MMQMEGGKIDDSRLLKLTKEIERVEEADAAHWRQRARLNWLAYGDRNTSVFHQRATNRKRKNNITELEDGRGGVIIEEEGKVTIIRNFFNELFQTSSPTATNIEKVMEAVQEWIRDEDFAILDKEYESGEVKMAIHEIHPTKAPGPEDSQSNFINGSGRKWVMK